MTQEPLTLYKLIVLYMLGRVSFPLTKAQVFDFILGRGYTDFLTLQQAMLELEDAGLIQTKPVRNRTFLSLTDTGGETLDYFGGRISSALRQDIDNFLQENRLRLRNEVAVQGTYYKSTAGEYLAELSVRDKGTELVSIHLSVPLEEMAISICENWQEKNQEIYHYLTEHLF